MAENYSLTILCCLKFISKIKPIPPIPRFVRYMIFDFLNPNTRMIGSIERNDLSIFIASLNHGATFDDNKFLYAIKHDSHHIINYVLGNGLFNSTDPWFPLKCVRTMLENSSLNVLKGCRTRIFNNVFLEEFLKKPHTREFTEFVLNNYSRLRFKCFDQSKELRKIHEYFKTIGFLWIKVYIAWYIRKN